MTKNTTIVIQTRHSDNHISSSFLITFPNEQRTLEALQHALPVLAVHGVMVAENNENVISLNGVKLEQNQNKKRTDLYRNTGN